MSRDHRKLTVFVIADELVTEVYRLTQGFPLSEQFGLQAQLRRAAVSVASNIVEGSARRSLAEYLHFLNVAGGSAAEASYLLEVAHRLGLTSIIDHGRVSARYRELSGRLQTLIKVLSTRTRS